MADIVWELAKFGIGLSIHFGRFDCGCWLSANMFEMSASIWFWSLVVEIGFREIVSEIRLRYGWL